MGDLSKEIPTVGKSSYHGEWSGTGKTTFANPKDLEADYEVNWQEQSLKGTLWGMNQSKATDSKEGFGKLDAQITSNTFNGKVTFNKLKMDASKQTAITDTFSGEIKVRGGFFGPNANELAGIGAKPSSDGVNADFLVMFSGKAVQSESTPNGSNQAQ